MLSKIETDQERVDFEAFVAAIFSSPSLDELHDHLKELNVPRPYRLRIKVLYSRKPFDEQFRSFAQDGKIAPVGSTGFAFRLDDFLGKLVPRRFHGFFALLPTASSSVRAAVSVTTREQWAVVLRYFRHRYPQLVPIFLSQKELIEGVLALKRSSARHEVRVRELSAKERVQSADSERLKSVREWTDEALEDVLANIEIRRQVISSLKMSFYKRISAATDVSPEAVCRVTKSGEVEVSGDFRTAWETVVSHVARVGAEKLDFFANRGLRETAYTAAALAIRFSNSVFKQTSDVRALVDILAKYPRSMHSVQHGNPYAHVQVSDIYDGSSFDVWAVNDKRIVIVPRLKASEAAIERLIDYIFTEFREGEVENFGRVA